ncbi:MAG TPA: putative CRISPR-associated protein [Thermodesulfobacteriota bacterium]|nr:putative CRISPR-associated protein [Thermodesulfobacteriota bacterium]
MRKMVLTTVGTSLIYHLVEKKTNLKNYADGIEGKPSKELDNYRREYDVLKKESLSHLKSLNLDKSTDLDKSSAEIKSLLKLGIGNSDVVYLFATETIDGKLCAEVLKDFIEEEFGCDVKLEEINGLQVSNPELFKKTGVRNYIDKATKIIENHHYQLILNTTGGFKAVVPYTTLLGMLFQIPVFYIFEETQSLIELPPLPLEYNFKIIEELKDKFYRIDLETSIPYDEFRKGIDDEKYKQCIALIEEEKGYVTLSAIGIAIWEKYKEDNPPLAPKSKKSPDEKDHLRELKQEPSRTGKFEKFREKLKNHDRIDDFWYLKGCNPSDKKIEIIGDELHIYYEGIALRVRTTAQYPKQFEVIKKGLEELLI